MAVGDFIDLLAQRLHADVRRPWVWRVTIRQKGESDLLDVECNVSGEGRSYSFVWTPACSDRDRWIEMIERGLDAIRAKLNV